MGAASKNKKILFSVFLAMNPFLFVDLDKIIL